VLDLTALTTLSQRWNTYVWLAGVGVAQEMRAVMRLAVAAVLGAFYLPRALL
jgi:hypothetical protein